MLGTWQGSGPRRPIQLVNRPPGPNGTTLYTPSYGATTPSGNGVFEAVLSPFPSATPNADLVGFVSENRRGGTPIPPGGAVLAARGTQAQRMAVEAVTADTVSVRLVLRPEWRDVPEALGGGPELDPPGPADLPARRGLRHLPPQPASPEDGRGPALGRADRDARRRRTPARLLLRDDELRAGADDGAARRRSRPPRSTRAARRRWRSAASSSAVRPTAAASGSSPRRSSSCTTACTPRATELSFSPNGDGAGDRQRLEYKIVKPSTVTATLTGPDGVARTIDSGERKPGLYKFAFAGGTRSNRAGAAEPEGRYRWSITAVDAEGRRSTAERSFSLNNTLGFISVAAVPHDRRTEARRPAPDRLHAHPPGARQRHDHVQDGPAAPRRAELQRPRRQDRRPLERQVPERQAGLLGRLRR